MSNNRDKDLELFIHKTLRSLPDRTAPRSLEQRVLARLSAQQALPWYHQPFSHWPAFAKIAFVGSTALALGLLTSSGLAGGSSLSSWSPSASHQIQSVNTLWSALNDSGTLLLRSIPNSWLYGTLAVIAALYASLFGLGATAYRTLLANR